MYYYECPECGSSLDPGEKCNCQIIKQQKLNQLADITEICEDGQLKFKDIINQKVS